MPVYTHTHLNESERTVSYTDVDFRTKKALKEAVAAYVSGDSIVPVTIYNPGMGTAPENGTAYLEGPHYPRPHTWYASVTVKDGVVVNVAK